MSTPIWLAAHGRGFLPADERAEKFRNRFEPGAVPRFCDDRDYLDGWNKSANIEADCHGWLAALILGEDLAHAYVRWIDPNYITRCQDEPPAALLAWIAGADWPKRAGDIPRLIAMSEHGTCSELYIESRDDPEKAYNARPEYVSQFVL